MPNSKRVNGEGLLQTLGRLMATIPEEGMSPSDADCCVSEQVVYTVYDEDEHCLSGVFDSEANAVKHIEDLVSYAADRSFTMTHDGTKIKLDEETVVLNELEWTRCFMRGSDPVFTLTACVVQS